MDFARYSIPASVAAAALLRNRVDHVVTVPDWVQLALHDRLAKGVGDIKVINCANENQVMTVAAGLTIGGKRPLVMMQNQGLYNCINTLRAVCLDAHIPLVFLVGQFGQEYEKLGRPLAHLLKNRFYIGEVAYRGEVHLGGHEAIVERDLFEAVQAKLTEQTINRKLARRRSPHLLTGKLFDDLGNLMSPSHANKKGVRYRYYTSEALLQGRKNDAGSVARVSAEEVERLVISALAVDQDASAPRSDRDAIDLNLVRATVREREVEIAFRTGPTGAQDPDAPPSIKSIPFTPFSLPKKGIQHRPNKSSGLTDADRTTILTAIARSKAWVEEVLRNPVETFESIATREGRSARYIKLLAPLAYVSPRLIEALVDGRPVSNMTITSLAKSLPLSWAEQERAYLPN